MEKIVVQIQIYKSLTKIIHTIIFFPATISSEMSKNTKIYAKK